MKIEEGESGFDMDSAVADLADSMGLGASEEETTETPEAEAEETESTAAPVGDTTTAPTKEGVTPAGAAVVPRAPPKSWAKEYHEDWSKLSPKQQEYIEKREKDFLDGTEQYRGEAAVAKQYREMLAPYRPMFAAAGIDEAKGVQYLLNAQYRLTNGTPAERAAAYKEMGQSLGIVAAEAADPNAPAPDPLVAKLTARLDGVESALTQRQQADLNTARAEAQKTIEKFKADPAHPFFDEVVSDMKPLVEAGLSLDDAYDRAIHANPITRQKVFDKRLADAAAEREEKAKKEGESAARATAHNVRGAETSRKAPTGKKGSMEDTMRDTLSTIRGRAH